MFPSRVLPGNTFDPPPGYMQADPTAMLAANLWLPLGRSLSVHLKPFPQLRPPWVWSLPCELDCTFTEMFHLQCPKSERRINNFSKWGMKCWVIQQVTWVTTRYFSCLGPINDRESLTCRPHTAHNIISQSAGNLLLSALVRVSTTGQKKSAKDIFKGWFSSLLK